MVKSINHVAVIVTDVERSRNFYQNVLGLKKIPRPQTRVPGEWLGIGDNQLHLVGEPAPEGKIDPRRPHMALDVEDIEEAKAALTRMGIRFVDPTGQDVIPMNEGYAAAGGQTDMARRS
jgi:catechol 2,3-dioxygenase-like lactoylglutathione lyase family enzyme